MGLLIVDEGIFPIGVTTRAEKKHLEEKEVIEISPLFDINSNINPIIENKVEKVSNEDWSREGLIRAQKEDEEINQLRLLTEQDQIKK